MESSGYVPSSPAMVEDLQALVTRPGPFATVFLPTESEVENAAQLSDLRWRPLRDQLQQAGAPAALLDAIDGLVPDAHLSGEVLAVVGDASGVLLAEHHPEPPAEGLARWAPLPSFGSIIEWRQASPPHLAVLVDRTGADIVSFRGAQEPTVTEVDSGRHPVHKVASGGWSQRHYQQRVEENWKDSAERVASEVASLVKSTGARVVAVTGDVRAVEMLRAALPREVAELVVPVEGGRGDGTRWEDVADAVVRAVATEVAGDTRAMLGTFKEERGEADRAADGPAATLRALAEARAGLLLVNDDPADERTAWFGPEAAHVATDIEDLRRMGVDEPRSARLVDVAIRAALGTGAGVRVVPAAGGPREGIGAILRWS